MSVSVRPAKRLTTIGAALLAGLTLCSAALAGSSGGDPGHVGGAPSPGSGSLTIEGFVRAIDGDTLEIKYRSEPVGVGLIGVDAPEGNTYCGGIAWNRLQELVAGGVRLDEQRGIAFDRRTRRMYDARVKGKLVALTLVQEGLARANGQGKHARMLRQAQAGARAARAGCLWGAGLSAVSSPSARTAAGGSVESLGVRTLQAAAIPSGFVEDVFASGFSSPTAIAWLPDGRLLVAEKGGIVKLVSATGQVSSTPVINIHDRVNDYWDHGLLSIAVDPGFASNGFIYLLYTYENNAGDYSGRKTNRLARYTMTGNTASPASEQVILGTLVGAGCDAYPVGSDCLPDDYPSHSIGTVEFASDGTLFVTVGDGASFNVVDDLALRAQNIDWLAGKVLHITTSGAGLSSNPFYNGNPSAARSKVWAYGLRNPFRLTLKPGSGVPYVGDVGWTSYEEIDVATAGANFGWPCYEGVGQQPGYSGKSTCQTLYGQGASAVKGPLVVYNHAGGSTATVGGVFYTGTAFPAAYQGAFFFADYARNWIKTITVSGSDAILTGPNNFATSGTDGPVHLEVGADGALYYLSIVTGQLRRIRYGAPPPPPPPPGGSNYLSDQSPTSAVNGWGPYEKDRSNGESGAGDGVTITLNGTAYQKGLGVHAASELHYSLGSACTTFQADIGVDDEVGPRGSVVFQVFADGTKIYDSGVMTGDTQTKSVNVDVTGKLDLQLTVTDSGNGKSYDHADWANARVACGSSNAPPVPTIATPAPTLKVKVGDTVSFTGSATDTEDGQIPASGLAWQVITHHCQGGDCHTHPLISASGSGGSFQVPDHADEVFFEIKLTATDSGGTQASTSINIYPKTVQLTLATQPSGLQVVFLGTTGASPMTVTVMAGATRTIFAPSPQGQNTFQSWSDGGAQQHNITLGETDVTLTATFSGGGGGGPTTTYLSDMTPTSATNGWGPVEKDKSNGESGAGDGVAITLNGATYAKGLGAHAVSDVRYNLAGGCATFQADVGIDDEVGVRGSVVFQVFADGVKIFDSGVMSGQTATQSVNVSVAGKNELRLLLGDSGNGKSYDHGDWAGARVTCGSGGGGDTTPPTVQSTSPAGGAGGVAVGVAPSATFSEAIDPATVSGSTFTLVKQSTGAAVAASVSYSAAAQRATLTPTASLEAGTVYTATVKGGAAGMKDTAGNPLASDLAWSFTTAAAGGGPTTTYLSDLVPASSANGWGPFEKDKSNGEAAAGDGATITLNGVTYAKGIGAHALSDLHYNLAGACSTVLADVGVDDEVGAGGSVVFQVFADGVKVFDSGVMNGSSPTQSVNVSVVGKSDLQLLVGDAGNGNAFDHADWADARVTCG